MKIAQIVRRFGPVGGQERYVWEVCLQLANEGHEVHVFCHEYDCITSQAKNIHIHLQKVLFAKPRWLNALLFDHSLRAQLHKGQYDLVHSHEKTREKSCVTIHSTPFAKVLKKPWYYRLGLRFFFNMKMECRQLFSPSNLHLIFVSKSIRKETLACYPELESRPYSIVHPGSSLPLQSQRSNPKSRQPKVGFLGREWKRKGFERSLSILKPLGENGKIQFISAGFPSEELPTEIDKSWHEHREWVHDLQSYFNSIDLLIHPAKEEAFGMVVIEAMSQGIPVLISDRCGAGEVLHDPCGKSLPLENEDASWRAQLLELLEAPPPKAYERSWKIVTQEHLSLYKQLSKNTA